MYKKAISYHSGALGQTYSGGPKGIQDYYIFFVF